MSTAPTPTRLDQERTTMTRPLRTRLAQTAPFLLGAALIAAAAGGVTYDIHAQNERAAAVATLEQAEANVGEKTEAFDEAQSALDAKKAELATLKEQLKSTEGFIE